jgi:hypothetical protein
MARNQNSGHVKLWSPRKPPARRRGPASPSRYGPGPELVGPALAGTGASCPTSTSCATAADSLPWPSHTAPTGWVPSWNPRPGDLRREPAGRHHRASQDRPSHRRNGGVLLSPCAHRFSPGQSFVRTAPRIRQPPSRGIDRPSTIHDMALTEHYIVLIIAPLFFDLAQSMAGSTSPRCSSACTPPPHELGNCPGTAPSASASATRLHGASFRHYRRQ